jgi:hypothetical protein
MHRAFVKAHRAHVRDPMRRIADPLSQQLAADRILRRLLLERFVALGAVGGEQLGVIADRRRPRKSSAPVSS